MPAAASAPVQATAGGPTGYGPASTRPPRASSALVLVRDGAAGPELLLVRRADRGDQNSNAWVFPGGLVDAGDAALAAWCAGAGAAQVHAVQGLEHRVAALRETFEEAGLLLARQADGQPLDDDAGARLASAEVRSQALPALCEAQGWRLDQAALQPIAHWITPLGLPKRFDTWFFLARSPQGQQVKVDGVEIVDHRWVTISALLARDAEVKVVGPARSIAQALGRHPSVDHLQAWAQALGPVAAIQPRLGRDAGGRVGPVLPDHPAFAEIGLLDPQGLAPPRSVLLPNEPVPLMPGLVRITTAGDGSGDPGRNSYLLCADCGSTPATSRWVLVDPVAADDAQAQALLRHLPGALEAVVIRTPVGANPGIRHLQALTGARLVSMGVPGEPIVLGPHLRLRAVAAAGAPAPWLLDEARGVAFGAEGPAPGAPPRPAGVTWLAPARGFIHPISRTA